MPVDDHPVHESVRINTDTFRYGCNNAERKPGYLASEALVIETKRIKGAVVNFAGQSLRFVEDHSSIGCHYEYRDADPGCRECEKDRAQ